MASTMNDVGVTNKQGVRNSQLLIIYRYMVPFPNSKAHTVQIAHTIYALANSGVEVHFYSSKYTRKIADCMSYYGLSHHENLKLRRYPGWLKRSLKKNGPLVRIWENMTFRRLRRRAPVFYLRDGVDSFTFAVRAAQMKDRWNCKLIMECHRVHAMEAMELLSGSGSHVAPEKLWLLRQAEMEEDGLNACDGVVAISQSLADCLTDTYKTTIHPTIMRSGAEECNKVNPTLHERTGIVYAGQLYAWKGLPTLIEAMRYCAPYKLNIVGGNNPSELEQINCMVRDLRLENQIKLIGHVPHNEVSSYILSARCGVIPLGNDLIARKFTSPIKIFEYMACGVPIVAANNPTVREVLQHEHNALLFEVDDPESMALQIRRVMEDDALSDRIRNQAQRDLKKYSWSERARKIKEFAGNLRSDKYFPMP